MATSRHLGKSGQSQNFLAVGPGQVEARTWRRPTAQPQGRGVDSGASGAEPSLGVKATRVGAQQRLPAPADTAASWSHPEDSAVPTSRDSQPQPRVLFLNEFTKTFMFKQRRCFVS